MTTVPPMNGGSDTDYIPRPIDEQKKGRCDRSRTAQGGHAVARDIGEETGHRRTGSVIAKLDPTPYQKVNKIVLYASFLRVMVNGTNLGLFYV